MNHPQDNPYLKVYYNPFYVTYRGRGSRENTEAFCPKQKTGFALRGVTGRTLPIRRKNGNKKT